MRYALPFFSVDQVQWLPGWVQASEDVVTRKLDEVAATDHWILDGFAPRASLERRLAAADTVIFVDLPLWMHFWLAAERQIAAARGEDRVDPLEGCDQLAVTRDLFELIWRVDQDLKPRLEAILKGLPLAAAYHRITTIEELERLTVVDLKSRIYEAETRIRKDVIQLV